MSLSEALRQQVRDRAGHRCEYCLSHQDYIMGRLQIDHIQLVNSSSWHSLMNPPQEAWWWYLDPPALFSWLEKPSPVLDKLDGLWKLVTIVTLATSI
jgi:hypothetical protein